NRQYDGSGDFRLHDMPGPDSQLHGFGRVRVTASPGLRPLALGPESLTLVDPSANQTLTLSWTDLEAATSYVVDLLPFDAPAPGPHAYTEEDGGRGVGALPFQYGEAMQGVAEHSSCRITLPADGKEGLYRWRVQGVGVNGRPVGEPSDWAFVVITAPRS